MNEQQHNTAREGRTDPGKMDYQHLAPHDNVAAFCKWQVCEGWDAYLWDRLLCSLASVAEVCRFCRPRMITSITESMLSVCT